MGYLVVGIIGAVALACAIGIITFAIRIFLNKQLPISRIGVLAFFNLFISTFTVVGVLQGRQSTWGLDLIVAGYLTTSVPLCFLWPQRIKNPKGKNVS